MNALGATVAAGGNPPISTPPAAPSLTSATAGDGSVALSWTAPGRRRQPAVGLRGVARDHRRRGGVPRRPGRAGHDLHRHHQRGQRHDLLLPGPRPELVGPGPLLQRALGDPDRAAGAQPRPAAPTPDQRHRRRRERGPQLDGHPADGGSPLSRLRGVARDHRRRGGVPRRPGRAGHDLHRHPPTWSTARPTTTRSAPRELGRPRSAVQRALGDPDRAAADRDPDRGHRQHLRHATTSQRLARVQPAA